MTAISTSIDSSKWRKPVITSTVQDRIQIALAALKESIQTLSPDGQFVSKYYQSGLLYSQMAEFDRISNQTLYKDKLLSFLQARETERQSVNPFLRDGLTYGYAALKSYTVYKESAFLDFAVNWWKWASEWTITDSEVASGAVSGKNFTLQTHCMANPVTGGTFDTLDPTNAVVSLLSSDYYFILSGLLAEATSDKSYLDSVAQSFNFIRSQLFTSSEYLPQNSITLNSQDPSRCTTAASVDSVNVGAWIEGLAVYNSLADDAGREQLVNGSFASAITKSDWHTSDQILLSPGTLMGNIDLPRGLATIYQRSKSVELRTDIEKYLAVQYNAILDLSTVRGSNMYSSNWTGPPPTNVSFDFDAQVTAQGVLLAAINLQGPDSGSSPDPQSSNHPGHSSSSVGAIAGGVVGGVTGLILVALGLFFYLRKRRASKETSGRGRTMDISPYEIHEGGSELAGMPASSVNVAREKEPTSRDGQTESESGRLPRINEEIQRLQADMTHVLQVLSQRPEDVGTQDLPPQYPGRS